MSTKTEVLSAPKVLGVDGVANGTRWLFKFGPLEYVIETAQPMLPSYFSITWLYFDTATRVRFAGRSVPFTGTLSECACAIERELLAIKSAIPSGEKGKAT